MLEKFFDTLANMGIWIRLNDSRTEPPSEQGREWGPTVDGFAISLAPLHEESVSVMIRNESAVERKVQLPGWLKYLHIALTGPDGAPVPLKPYGAEILDSPQTAKPVERDFPAGKSLVTEIPLSALFDLKLPGAYRIRVAGPVPGHPALTVVSNELALPIKGQAR
jgi:hypothetical protein